MPLDDFFGSLDAFPFSETLRDLDALEEYFSMRDEALSKISASDPSSLAANHVVIKGNVHIGEDCDIDPFVLIEGPAWIGNRVKIRSGALIRAGTILGDDVVIGHGAEIKNAHVAAGAKLQSNVFVGDSIIGTEVRIGSGTILANRRFDQAVVFLDLGGNKVPVGRDKFGAVIGDRTRIGANATTAPGTMIGPDCIVYSNASIAGTIPGRSIVKLRSQIEIVPRQGDNFTLSSRDSRGKL